MQPSDVRRSATPACRGADGFEPSVALGILGTTTGLGSGAGSAWDAAWIACLTNSPRWAETARREFAAAMNPPAPAST